MPYKLSPSNIIHQLFFYFHSLSLDTALGACLLAGVFEKLFPIHIPFYLYLLLFNSILLVYWTDHLQDSYVGDLVQLSRLHLLFFNRRKIFVTLSLLLLVFNAALAIYYLSFHQLIVGLIPAGLLLIYLGSHRKWPHLLLTEKEFFTALLYASSIGLLPFLITGVNGVTFNLVVTGISFLIFCAAYINTLSKAIIEAHNDHLGNIRNMAHHYSQNLIIYLQLLAFVAQLMAAIILFIFAPYYKVLFVGIALILISLVQLLLPKIAQNFNGIVYRYIGEGSFLAAGLFCYFL